MVTGNPTSTDYWSMNGTYQGRGLNRQTSFASFTLEYNGSDWDDTQSTGVDNATATSNTSTGNGSFSRKDDDGVVVSGAMGSSSGFSTGNVLTIGYESFNGQVSKDEMHSANTVDISSLVTSDGEGNKTTITNSSINNPTYNSTNDTTTVIKKDGSATISRHSLSVDAVDRLFGVTTARTTQEWDRVDASEHNYDYFRDGSWQSHDSDAQGAVVDNQGTATRKVAMRQNVDRHAFGNKISVSVDGGTEQISETSEVVGTGDGFVKFNTVYTDHHEETIEAIPATENEPGRSGQWKLRNEWGHSNVEDTYDYTENRSQNYGTGVDTGYITNEVAGIKDIVNWRHVAAKFDDKPQDDYDITALVLDDVDPDEPTSYSELIDHAGYSPRKFTYGSGGAGSRPTKIVIVSASGGEPTEGPTTLQEKFGQVSESVGQAIGEAAIATSQWVLDKIGSVANAIASSATAGINEAEEEAKAASEEAPSAANPPTHLPNGYDYPPLPSSLSASIFGFLGGTAFGVNHDSYGVTVLNQWKGFFYLAPKEMIEGLIEAGAHPIKTLQSLKELAVRLGTDPKTLWDAIVEEVKTKASTPQGQGQLAFGIVTTLLTGGAGATKNISKTGKLAKLLDKSPSGIFSKLDDAIADANKWIRCFSRNTLVSTETGLRPIGAVTAGDRVHSYDFSRGCWALRIVTDRIDNLYSGPVITIFAAESEIETTVYHPFWVVEGRDFEDRSVPRELSAGEDQGQTLQGRWVNSHELRVGDVIVGQSGQQHRIDSITQRYEESFPVTNLTIGEYHNFAVGTNSILVHNTSICDNTISDVRSGKLSRDDFIKNAKADGKSDADIAIALGKIDDPTWKPIAAKGRPYTPSSPHSPPNRRHNLGSINQKTRAHGDTNTVIMPEVDVAADVAAINAGKGIRTANQQVHINGRIYGYHPDTGRLFPISGKGSSN